MKRVGMVLVLAALMVSLSACVWNLDESDVTGRLAIRFDSNDAVGAQNLNEFDTIAVFVADASIFRTDEVQVRLVDWQGISTFLRDLYTDREEFLSVYDPAPHAAPTFAALNTPFQENAQFPGGQARILSLRFDPDNRDDGILFENLVVGREYVVWIDAVSEIWEPPLNYFGFGATRIRSGAETSLTINLQSIGPEDDDVPFFQFAEFIANRYVLPSLPPPPPSIDFDGFIEEGSFRFDEYIGTGSASVIIDGQELFATFDRADVSRVVIEYEGQTYTLFYLWFEPSLVETDDVAVGLTIFEHGLVLEPTRGAYSLNIEPAGIPAAGSIIGVEIDYFDLNAEQFLLFEKLPQGAQFGFAGFGDGIGPNSQGSFFADQISGTFERFDWFDEQSLGTSNVAIESLSFSFQQNDLAQLFASEFFIGDIGPAGGHVFYIDDAEEFDWTYLEAAPSDTEWTFEPWRPTRIAFAGALSTALGEGQANTQAIVQTVGAGNYAASRAANLSINGFDDWFLPSRAELTFMRDNLATAGIGGFSDVYYWSSSKPAFPEDQAIALPFPEGFDATIFNDLTFLMINEELVPLNVRAIRAFNLDELGFEPEQ